MKKRDKGPWRDQLHFRDPGYVRDFQHCEFCGKKIRAPALAVVMWRGNPHASAPRGLFHQGRCFMIARQMILDDLGCPVRMEYDDYITWLHEDERKLWERLARSEDWHGTIEEWRREYRQRFVDDGKHYHGGEWG